MFDSIQQGLEVYKAELAKYKEWSEQKFEEYGGRKKLAENGGPMAAFGNPDLKKLEDWNTKLQGMISVLGLTKEEDAAIDKEVGIFSAAT